MKHLVLLLIFFLACLTSFSQKTHNKQTAVVGRDVVADAPWRMKKTDNSGNLKGIPIHIFIQDANLVECNADLIYLNIYIKNATDATFGNPIVFDTYSSNGFQSLFSSKSVTDAAFGVQSFDESLPVADPNYTIQFTSDYSWTDDTYYVDVKQRLWYFTFTIPPEKLAGFNDIVDIEVYFSLDWETDDVQYLRVFRSNNDIPKLPGWRRGDAHYHTIYTNNSAEFGLPLNATKEIAKAVGLDWISSTNHSCDYDNYGTSMLSNWNREKAEIQTLNATDNSMIFIHGMEASVNNSAGNTIHMLCYPNSSSPYSMPYLGDGNGDITATSITIDDLLNSLTTCGGFSYAAHPFAGDDKLSSLINGGIWNVNDPDFLANGAPIPGNDVVICNNPSSPSDLYFPNSSQKLFKDRLKGGQIWNYRNAMMTTDQKWDQWNVTYDSGITAFAPYDLTDTYYHYNRLLQGLEVAKFLNKKGLIMKNSNNNLQNYKFFMSAGSDAHGDFNSSNTNFVYGFTLDISDAAIGKPSTLVYCPTGMGATGGNVLNSLENGHVIFSDGPLISIGISTDGNNNTLEYIIGQEAIPTSVEYFQSKLKMDIATTPEFGTISSVNIIAGTINGEYSLPIYVNPYIQNGGFVFSLDSLVQHIVTIDSISANEYFYLRAELTTYINHGSQSAIYCRPNETFHCFTNPIWIRKPTSPVTSSEQFSSNNSLKVFPNPAYDFLTIISPTPYSNSISLKIYDILGNQVTEQNYSASFKNDLIRLSIQNLPKGVYYISIVTDNFSSGCKFVKN